MFFQVMKHAALSAKVHAMTATTLHQADYEALMQLHTVPEAANYLNENTRYQNVLRKTGVSTLHRGKLERLLRIQTQKDLLSLLRYTDTGSSFFLKFLDLRENIEKIKLFLRLLYLEHPEQILEQGSDILVGSYRIRTEALAQVTDFASFLELLRPTPFYRALRSFLDDPQRQQLFYLEMALDTYWAKFITRYAKKYLSAEESKAVLRIFGTELDLDNLVFLLRCKERFTLSEEEIYACMIPYPYRLSETVITNIVQAPSVAAAQRIIAEQTPYGAAFSDTDRFYEARKNRYMYKLCKHLYASHTYSPVAAVCYIYLRHIEIDDIVSIIEGIRYELSPEEIKKTLIGYCEGGDNA